MPVTSTGKHLPYPEGRKRYIGEKINKLVKEGKSKDRSIAIALSMARKKK
jgi:ribosome-associated translation inhibitor RaiA